MQDSIPLSTFRRAGSRGGKLAWKGKTKAQRSDIMRNRAQIGWETRRATKKFRERAIARKASAQAASWAVKAR
jgi:hypothetical protein